MLPQVSDDFPDTLSPWLVRSPSTDFKVGVNGFPKSKLSGKRIAGEDAPRNKQSGYSRLGKTSRQDIRHGPKMRPGGENIINDTDDGRRRLATSFIDPVNSLELIDGYPLSICAFMRGARRSGLKDKLPNTPA